MNLYYNIHLNNCWGWKLYATIEWIHSETSSHSAERNNDCMHAGSSGELRCTEDWIVTIWCIHWGLQGWLTLTDNCNLRSCRFFTRALMSCSLRTSLMMAIGSHTLFSERSFGAPNVHLVRIELCLHSKHWELRPLWVSVVHGWAGVAGHLVQSLSRICLLKFLLSSWSSFGRARWCRCYVRIWKERSKHTTRQYRVKWGW